MGAPQRVQIGILASDANGIRVVTQGTIEYEVAGKPVIVKAGEVLFVPHGIVHAARNVGEGPAAELATYVV